MIRLNKVKVQLKDNDDNIASIVLDWGYNDPEYFSRVLKQEFNITEQEWRAGARMVN